MPATLLLVHANTDDRGMYAEYLQAHDYAVVQVPTTDAAMPLLESVDAVITGLLVPGSIDGVELIRRVRRRWSSKEKPIVVVTACMLTETRQQAQHAGCDVLLTKPCLPDFLLKEVRRLLAGALQSQPASPLHE